MGEKETIHLKVAEALGNDVGRGIARLGAGAREKLGVSSGDVVKLSGKKNALAIVWPSHPSEEEEKAIRMDGILRQNSGVGLGDKVKVSKTEVKEAKKIVLAPRQPVRFHAGFDQYVKKKLIGKPLIKGNILPIGVFGTPIPLVVFNTNPPGPLMVTEKTQMEVRGEPVKQMANVPSVTYDDVGGLTDEVQKIREMVELPLRHPELFERVGIEPPKGVLMHGPPGTGKTLLAKAVANESDANFFYLGGPEIVSKYVGESEQKLRQLFEDAQKNAPSILFIDEIDAIAPKREEVTGEVERRMVSQLLCVEPETLIYTPEGPVKAKELYEQTDGKKYMENEIEFLKPENLRVYSLGKEGKMGKSKVKTMNRLTVPQTFEIRLDNGAKTRVSPIQRFLTVRNSALAWVPVTELRGGDYVACPATLPRKKEEKRINLLEKLDEKKYTLRLDGQLKAVFGREYISLKGFRHYLHTGKLMDDGTLRTKILNLVRERGKTSVDELIKEFRVSGKDNITKLVSSLEKAGCVETHRKRRNEFRKIVALPVINDNLEGHITGISVFRYFQRYIKKNYFMKPVTKLTPELSELLGYLLADGSLANGRLNISGTPEIVERAEYLIKCLFGFKGKITKIHEKYWRYDAACQTLPAIFNEIFGVKIGKKAYGVQVPEQLFTATDDCIKAFIRAYADCDGSLGSNLRIFSRSKKLATDMSYLLSCLGFGASYSKAKGMHYCNLLGGNNAIAKYAAEIGSLREDRQAFFITLLSKRSVSSRIERVPNIPEAINAMKSGFSGLASGDYRYLTGTRNMNKGKMESLMMCYEGQSQKAETFLRYLLNAEIRWSRVVSVEQRGEMEMYDLTTAGWARDMLEQC
ncbi:MAG: AAA family ATPase, partial [Candidatus Micrarchaeia archaeon]